MSLLWLRLLLEYRFNPWLGTGGSLHAVGATKKKKGREREENELAISMAFHSHLCLLPRESGWRRQSELRDGERGLCGTWGPGNSTTHWNTAPPPPRDPTGPPFHLSHLREPPGPPFPLSHFSWISLSCHSKSLADAHCLLTQGEEREQGWPPTLVMHHSHL